MREDLTGRLVEALRARTIDAALIALPYEAHGIVSAPIAEDEFFFLCPDDHPLAKRNDLSPEHLKSEDVLLLEDGHCLRDHALAACRLPSSKRSTDVGATSLHTLVQMVGGGMGVTLVAEDRGGSGRDRRCACCGASVRDPDCRALARRCVARGRPARRRSADAGGRVARAVLGGRPVRLRQLLGEVRQANDEPNRRPDVAEDEDRHSP